MPSGQEQPPLQHTIYHNSDPSILRGIKEQEAQFQQLSQELDSEPPIAAGHLERYKIRDPEDGSSTYTDNPYLWRPTPISTVIPEVSETDPKMSESHMHYYPDHAHPSSSLPDYLKEAEYTKTYETSTNGHEDVDAPFSSNASETSIDNASIISRSTSQIKTKELKTVTKIIKSREVIHVGPDGKPLSGYSPYGRGGTLPSADYGTYAHNYDGHLPPSPAGETPQVFAHYPGASYRTTSPASSGRNFDLYGETGVISGVCEPYSEYGFSDSPNLHRAMPETPRQTANYEDIENSSGPPLVPNRIDYRTPSPSESADRFGTYGYTGEHPVNSSAYAYDAAYLDPPSRSHTGYDDKNLHARGYDVKHDRDAEECYNETLANESGFSYPIPPHPHLEYAVEREGCEERDGVKFLRDPDLSETISFLKHPNSSIASNAAAYLGHLCFMHDAMKKKARALGCIPPLVELLDKDIPELSKNACGALRNISYGRGNDENKRAIKNANGIPTLVKLLKKSACDEIKELITGILWNLSSCEDLKLPILEEALTILVYNIIIPHSGYNGRNPFEHPKPKEIYYSHHVFRNASGVLRNISSAGEHARKTMRNINGLIEASVFIIQAAIQENHIDNKSVENIVCILRNLSYRCYESENQEENGKFFNSSSRTSAPDIKPIRGLFASLAVTENLGCFGTKKKEESETTEKERKDSSGPKNSNQGLSLLYQPEMVKSYLALLSECSNPETLEAAAGIIQNLSASSFTPSCEIRSSVRKEKGLPVLVELLRMPNDSVVCSVATALRNLATESRNRCLIGNYAMKDLILKLPNGSASHDSGTSDDTIAAVLLTLNEVVAENNSDFARSLLDLGGVERLCKITKSKDSYSPRVVKFASQLLFNMWQHSELKEAFRKAGFKESHFVTKKIVRNSVSSPTGANSTLNRPSSSEGGTKYEDQVPHGNELNSMAASIAYSRSEELPLSELSHNTEPSQIHMQHMGVFPPGMQQACSPSEPLYAQVNRDKKREKAHTQHRHHNNDGIPVQLLTHNQSDDIPAGDSWV